MHAHTHPIAQRVVPMRSHTTTVTTMFLFLLAPCLSLTRSTVAQLVFGCFCLSIDSSAEHFTVSRCVRSQACDSHSYIDMASYSFPVTRSPLLASLSSVPIQRIRSTPIHIQRIHVFAHCLHIRQIVAEKSTHTYARIFTIRTDESLTRTCEHFLRALALTTTVCTGICSIRLFLVCGHFVLLCLDKWFYPTFFPFIRTTAVGLVRFANQIAIRWKESAFETSYTCTALECVSVTSDCVWTPRTV